MSTTTRHPDRFILTARRRRLACLGTLAASALVVVATLPMSSSAGSGIVPPPCGVPGTPACPTTTTRPTIPTTTSSTTVPATSPPTVASTTSSTVAPSPPATTGSTAPVTTTADTVSPDAPPSSLPETAAFVISSPVIVDPGDPAPVPPVIVGVTTVCADANTPGSATVAVLNADLYHYSGPFPAAYNWTVLDGDAVLAGGTVDVFVGNGVSIAVAPLPDAGTYQFTVTDSDLEVSATADIVIVDCFVGPQAPWPLSPLVVVPAMTCSDSDYSPSEGTAQLWVSVLNPSGDEGSTRTYDFDLTFDQVVVEADSLGDVADGAWATKWLFWLHSGTHMVHVFDQNDPTLEANVQVEIPPCPADPPPPADPAPPLLAPILDLLPPTCANVPIDDGAASFIWINPNFLFLGGTVTFFYDWEVTSTTGTVESSVHNLPNPGTSYGHSVANLAPGTYTATLTDQQFPQLSDSVTFDIVDCAGSQADYALVSFVDVWNVCIPGDDTETVMFTIFSGAQPPSTDGFDWFVGDTQAPLDQGTEWIAAQSIGLAASRHLPEGVWPLTMTDVNDPQTTAETSIDVGACLSAVPDPPDSTEPIDSTDTNEPSDTEAPTATSTGTSDATGTSADSTAGGGGVDLSGVCPETVVIQTDWNPEAEHGWVYQMVGDDPTIDAATSSVSGPLMAPGEVDTGVDIEIRSGGPAIGFQTVTSQMYADESITLGYVSTDEGIQNASEFPTVAVYAGMEKNPQMIMWDPATYPDVQTVADLGTAGVTIRYVGGAAYMEYFVQSGILSADQVDGSYDGTAAAFVAAEGEIAQQGFGSAEPYIYENEVADWGRPVAYDYISDTGWETYGESIAVRADQLDEMRDCLTALVPIIQQSSVDYFTDPAETNALILDAVNTFDNGWVYTQGVADYAVETMIDDGLIGNGPNETIGDFDLDRANGLIQLARPVYAALGQEPPADLTAEDIVTNEFIDPSIGLPAELAATTSSDTMGTETTGTSMDSSMDSSMGPATTSA